MKAEALKWENRRLAESKAKLEAQLQKSQRRLSQMEDAVAELKSSSKQGFSARGPHSSFKVRRSGILLLNFAMLLRKGEKILRILSQS